MSQGKKIWDRIKAEAQEVVEPGQWELNRRLGVGEYMWGEGGKSYMGGLHCEIIGDRDAYVVSVVVGAEGRRIEAGEKVTIPDGVEIKASEYWAMKEAAEAATA